MTGSRTCWYTHCVAHSRAAHSATSAGSRSGRTARCPTWMITRDHQRDTWRHGFGIKGENTPRTWINASPYDVTLSDGTELEASGSPAWIAGRGGDCPEPADLPDPVPGQAVIVTEAIALL